MDSIPYFLTLIKKNTLLYSIIISGNLSSINEQTEHKYAFYTDKGVELYDFKLTEQDIFKSVLISDIDDEIIMIINPYKDDYFLKNVDYFGKKTIYADGMNLENNKDKIKITKSNYKDYKEHIIVNETSGEKTIYTRSPDLVYFETPLNYRFENFDRPVYISLTYESSRFENSIQLTFTKK
jgi:hypothetical protein